MVVESRQVCGVETLYCVLVLTVPASVCMPTVHQVELIIVLRSKRVIVRCEKTNVYMFTLTRDLPKFDGVYYLGGVPDNKMPKR